MFDFFDSGIMEGLQHRLRQISVLTDGTNSITFQGQCTMRRMTFGGVKECFVQWSPREIISDEWLPESKSPYVKTVDIRRMKPAEKTRVESLLMTAYKLPYFPNLFERIIAHKYEQTNTIMKIVSEEAESNSPNEDDDEENETEAEAEAADDDDNENENDNESNNEDNDEDVDEEEEENEGTDETDVDTSTTITSNTNNTTTTNSSLEQLLTSISKINLLRHKKHARKPQRTTKYDYNASNNKSLL